MRADSELVFALEQGKKIDLVEFNMIHCFKGTFFVFKIFSSSIFVANRTVNDFMPAIHSIANWPTSDFTMAATIYNQWVEWAYEGNEGKEEVKKYLQKG